MRHNTFSFDKVFSEMADNDEVYRRAARPLVSMATLPGVPLRTDEPRAPPIPALLAEDVARLQLEAGRKQRAKKDESTEGYETTARARRKYHARGQKCYHHSKVIQK